LPFFENLWDNVGIACIKGLQCRSEYLFTLFNVPSNIEYYLDIGTGHCSDALLFGKFAQQVLALDIDFPKWGKTSEAKHKKLTLIKADGRRLPFKRGVFQMISLFSVLEHIPEKEKVLLEVFRVLREHGVLLLQIPNRYFPIELHGCLPFINYVPYDGVRKALLRLTGASYWHLAIDIPSLKRLILLIKQANPQTQIVSINKILYPTEMLPSGLRKFAALLSKMGFFTVFPYGYCLTLTA